MVLDSLALPLRALEWLGRLGAKGIAFALVAGIALPQLSATLKPWLAHMVALFLVLAFVRFDLAVARRLFAAPGAIVLAVVWCILSVPLAETGLLALTGRQGLEAGVLLALALQAAAPPILATPAVAMLIGLDATFILIVLMIVTILTPLTAPLMASLVAGDAVPLDRMTMARNLALVIGSAAVIATAIRHVVPLERIRALRMRIDGVNVFFFFLFAIAIMDGFPAAALARPGFVLVLMGIAFLVAALGLAASLLVLRRLGAGDRFVTGFATGHRNAGLMVAAMGGVLPDTTWLYFALVQLPIYLMPYLVQPLARRIVGPAERG